MKKKNTKKDFRKFEQRAKTHVRKKRAAAEAALARAVAETGTNMSGAKIRIRENNGRPGRSGNTRKDEKNAVGILSIAQSGFGFVAPEGTEDAGDRARDIFVPAGGIGSAMSGDRVEVAYHTYRGSLGDERTEGRIVRILDYGRKTLIGTLVSERVRFRGGYRERFYLLPDDYSLHLRPYVNGTEAAEPPVEEGDKVEVTLLRDRGSARYMEADFVRSFGKTYSREANYGAILSECNVETEFLSEELAAADRAASEPISEEGRSVRREIIFTIDGEGAKDLDDAVSVRKLPGGKWQLGVHIADVSHYVREKTELDRLAMRRGTSIYFVDKVIPMLPQALSNGACSLNPGEKKYALSAMLTLSDRGEILKTEILPSVIESRVRGVYSEVNAIFDGTASAEIQKKYKPVRESLEKMHELYVVLKKKSEARGAIELEDDDLAISLDENGLPVAISRVVRGDAEKMIEQFMLAANEAVATFLCERGIPCVYRVHSAPPEEKREAFFLYLYNLGIATGDIDREKITPSDYRKILDRAEEKDLGRRVSTVMLRSMAKAVYSDFPSPHFGLSIERYCHFTSPIRRLSDLATHRIIHRVLEEGKNPDYYRSYAKRAAAAATEGEQRALTAERRIEALYQTLYLADRIGEVYPAAVSSVTAFGIFAELENGCEGLIPLSEFPESAFYDAATLTVRTRSCLYRTGDPIVIRVEEADVIRGKSRFSLVVTDEDRTV